MKIPIEKVFDVIKEERIYQFDKWHELYDDSEWSIGDWLIFIERYLYEAKSHIGENEKALDSIRKIAALAVACMEWKGAPERYK